MTTTFRRVASLGALSLLFGLAACSEDNNVLTLEEGQCFQDPENESSVANVEIVDCDEDHDNEIFHVEELEGGEDDFPGDSEVQSTAQEVCTEEVVDFLGGTPQAIGADISALFPTEQTWTEANDRAIVCFVFDAGGDELDESLEDAAEGVEEPSGGDGGGGGDQDFSALIDECEGGDNAACDELYFATPVGSEEERIGATCGGRSEIERNGSCETSLGG